MDGFQTFNTGNRKKFVEQTKKKKSQISNKTSLSLQQTKVIKIQSHIRRYLATNRYLNNNGINNYQARNFSLKQIVDNLYKLLQGNLIIFNRFHRLAIVKGEQESKQRRSEQEFGQERQLGKYADKICMIFDSLKKNQIIYWLTKIVKYNIQFSFQMLSQHQQMKIHNIITQNQQQFIYLIGCIDEPSIIYQIISISCRYQKQTVSQKTNSMQDISQKKPQINKVYSKIMSIIRNTRISQLGNYPIFILSVLNKIIDQLVTQCQLQIMKNYKIDPIYLKIQQDLLEQVINQKQQWQSFLEYINICNKINISVIHWFIQLNNFQDSVKVSQYISIIFKLIPLQYPLKLTIQQLMICLTKITNWIKLHQIATNQDQQRILLPYLYIFNNIFFRLTDNQFIALARKEKDTLERMLKDKFIKILYKIILHQKVNSMVEEISKICVNLLQEIYNKIFRTGVLSIEIFVNHFMSKNFVAFTFGQKDNQIAQFLHKFPFIFSLNDRARKFSQMLRNSHYYAYDQDQDNHYWNAQIRVRRGFQFQDAFRCLHKYNMKRHFKVTFINQFGENEKGMDAGGLTKQLINRVLKAAFTPQFGMFVQNSEKQLLAHPGKASSNSQEIAKYYQFIGKMIGKALYESITIGPKFCGPFLNAIIGKKNNFDDLRKIDKHLYNSLSYIKTMEENAKDLFLTFQYKDETIGKYVNLKKDGNKIPVTNQNKDEYVSLLANYKVNKLLEFQSRNIRKGLKSVINSEWLFMFNYEELNFLISGSGQIKISQLRAHTRYLGYNSNDLTIKIFWKVVSQFDQQTKSNLLMFVTACPRPSFLGFQQLNPQFTILKKQDITLLPVSHTCSNILELPDYKNQQQLAQKLKMAINSNSGFDIA